MTKSNKEFERFLKKLDVTGEQERDGSVDPLPSDGSANDELHPDSPIRKISLNTDKFRRKPSNQK